MPEVTLKTRLTQEQGLAERILWSRGQGHRERDPPASWILGSYSLTGFHLRGVRRQPGILPMQERAPPWKPV